MKKLLLLGLCTGLSTQVSAARLPDSWSEFSVGIEQLSRTDQSMLGGSLQFEHRTESDWIIGGFYGVYDNQEAGRDIHLNRFSVWSGLPFWQKEGRMGDHYEFNAQVVYSHFNYDTNITNEDTANTDMIGGRVQFVAIQDKIHTKFDIGVSSHTIDGYDSKVEFDTGLRVLAMLGQAWGIGGTARFSFNNDVDRNVGMFVQWLF